MRSETFPATGARVASTLNKTNGTASGIAGSATGFGGGVSLAFDATTGGYTVRDAAGASSTFLPASRSPGDSNAIVSVYNQTAGATNEQLVLFNPGAANTRMALTYVSYGAWQRLTDAGPTIDIAQQFFVYGIRQAADAPSTGSASYSTIVDGVWASPSGIYSLAGTSGFTANFSAKTVATTLDLIGTNVVTGGNKTLGLFNGSGSIATLGGGFNGTLQQQGTDTDGQIYSGSFAGAFFGPQGQEVGYTFGLTGPGGAASGAVVGKSN